MEVLEKVIKRTAIGSLVVAVLSLLIGLGLLAGGGVTMLQKGVSEGGFMTLMGLGGLGVAWALSSNGREALPAKSSVVYRVFESEPHRLAWIYERIGKTNGVLICLDNGHEYGLDANREDSAAIMALAQQRAPQAIFGFGEQQRDLYRQRLGKKAAS